MIPVFDILAKSIALLVIAAVAVYLLRNRSASLKALVLTMALAGLLLIPALTQLLPSWRLTILPAPAHAMPTDGVLAPSGLERPGAPVTPGPGAGNEEPVLQAAEPSVSAPPEGAGPGSTRKSINWVVVALAVWALGSMVLLLRLALSHRALTRIARLNPELVWADATIWHRLVDQVRAELGIRRAVAVRVTDAVSVPAVAGVFRPVLLIPLEADEWSLSFRTDVARHELAHVVRWDGLSQLIGHLACALQWFNPMVWLTAHYAAAFRERACDDVVLRAGTRASDYATNLLNLAHQAIGAELQPAALAMARPNRIRERVMSVLNPGTRRDSVSGRASITVLLLAGSAITAVAAVQPASRSNQAGSSRLEAPTSKSGVKAAPAFPEDLRTGASTMVAWGDEAVSTMPADTTKFCGDLHNSSSSINEDDEGRKWTVKMRGDRCDVDLSLEGKVEFNDDFTDITSISRGGHFRLDATIDGVRRELEIENGSNGLERVYRVNGREQEYDQAARTWFAGFLIEMDRRTAIAVDIRLPRLLRQGGVNAVLTETALMQSDHARNVYYTKLMAQQRLTSAERRQVLEQAARLINSDFYATELLKAVIAQGRLEDPAERDAVVAMVKRMDSDFYRAESMKVLTAGRLSSEQMTALLEVTADMGSDFYKSEMLKQLLSEGELTPAQRATVLEAASSIESDFYVGEVLKLLTERGMLGSAERTAFLRTVGNMESDNGIAEVLKTLMQHHELSADEVKMVLEALPQVESDFYQAEIVGDLLGSTLLTEADLLKIVARVRLMESDFYTSETLQKVLEHRAATDGVRKAVREAADAMDGHYGRELRRMAGDI